MAAMLNREQLFSVNMAMEGHNFVILGSAGTGKSYVVSNITERLRKIGRTVALTCSTGIACLVYPKHLQAMTIHRFTGIDDGRYGPGEIGEVIKNSVKHSRVLQNIKQTDVLIIDECSMISVRTLECIEEVMALKNNRKLFGGIQVILCGDFLQLPPVKDICYGDSGLYCFESMLFGSSFPHRVVLKDIMRQSENKLISAIREVAHGSTVSKETISFIHSLERPLPISQEWDLKLFAKNELVDEFNRQNILEFPGQIVEYVAKDEGEQKYRLDKLTVPKTLWLKIGIPVILLRNLTTRLVNGLRGFVMDIDDQGPTIEFSGVGITTKISKYTFEVFSPRLNKIVAVRTQFPIKPAFGLTIHKAQGMTLERVELDCYQIFQAGQLGVAMSRAKTADGLRVTNFHPGYCIQHPEKVTRFIEEDTLETTEDNSCCRDKNREESNESAKAGSDVLAVSENIDIGDPEDQFDKEFDDVIRAIDADAREVLEFNLPEDFSINEILHSMKTDNPITAPQVHVNTILSNFPALKLELFCKKEFIFLTKIFEDLNISEPRAVQSKELTQFYTKVHKHLCSIEYRLNCMSVFDYSHDTFTDDHLYICYEGHLAVRKYLLEQKTKLFTSEYQKIPVRFLTIQSKARLRYVSGYCIAKLLFRYSKKKK